MHLIESFCRRAQRDRCVASADAIPGGGCLTKERAACKAGVNLPCMSAETSAERVAVTLLLAPLPAIEDVQMHRTSAMFLCVHLVGGLTPRDYPGSSLLSRELDALLHDEPCTDERARRVAGRV